MIPKNFPKGVYKLKCVSTTSLPTFVIVRCLVWFYFVLELLLEGNFLKLIQGNYEKPTGNIIFNGKGLAIFHQKQGIGKDVYLLFPFNVLLEVLANIR